MKGWILLENNKPMYNSDDALEVYKTKKDLLNAYAYTLSIFNSIKRVKLE